MKVLTRKLRTIRDLPRDQRRLAVKTIGLMATVRLALSFAPFTWVKQQVESGTSRLACLMPDGISAEQVAWAVRLASRYIPGASCLTQALTAQVLLNRARIENRVYLGVTSQAPGGFAAHAWVEHAGTILIGGSESLRYAPILSVGASSDIGSAKKQ
jgi:hypothetical protein